MKTAKWHIRKLKLDYEDKYINIMSSLDVNTKTFLLENLPFAVSFSISYYKVRKFHCRYFNLTRPLPLLAIETSWT